MTGKVLKFAIEVLIRVWRESRVSLASLLDLERIFSILGLKNAQISPKMCPSMYF